MDATKATVATPADALLQQYWATLQPLLARQFTNVEEVVGDDAAMTKGLHFVYRALPMVVRVAIKEDMFIQYCLANRSRLVGAVGTTSPDRSDNGPV